MNSFDSRLRPDRGVYPLNELLQRSSTEFGDLPAMRSWHIDHYHTLTYRQLSDQANSIAKWLINNNTKPGDRIAVLGENRPEWGTCYLAIQMAGGVVVPVDSLMPSAGIRHIIQDSESRLLFVSGKFLQIVTEMTRIETLEKIVCFDDDTNTTLKLQDIIRDGSSLSPALPARQLDELAAILYTSGTTGHSKGVMLSQRNIMSNVAAASRIFILDTNDTFLSVLPIHHAFEATAGFLLPLYCGSSITYARSMKSNELIEDIVNTKVTMLIGVPLLFEKMHAGIERGIKKKGKTTQTLFNTMYGIVAVSEKAGLGLGKTLFKGLRQKGGFSTVRYFVSGGGPLDPNTALFFNRLGIAMVQGYGLTETSPVTHVNPPWKPKNETVGQCIPDVQHKIHEPNTAGIGEVCVKGPNVFMGYYKNEQATKEVLEPDGWFHTGDLGKIHADGYLQIMGRMKNMIVTGGGKNVYPEEIEHYLNHSSYIAESLVMGASRESGYGEEAVALIYPDYEQLDIYFQGLGKKPTDEDVFNLIKQEVSAAQVNLAEYKHIRRFRVVEEEFQKTSTRKIKRFLYDGKMVKIN